MFSWTFEIYLTYLNLSTMAGLKTEESTRCRKVGILEREEHILSEMKAVFFYMCIIFARLCQPSQ